MKYLPWNTTEEDLVWAFGYGLTIEVEIGGWHSERIHSEHETTRARNRRKRDQNIQ
jgi:hypothetical protein